MNVLDYAMQMEADDAVQDLLWGAIDGNIGGQLGQQRRKLVHALVGDEQRRGAMPGSLDEHAQDHFALGDEMPLASDEVALAHVAIGGKARIGGILDGDDGRQGDQQ